MKGRNCMICDQKGTLREKEPTFKPKLVDARYYSCSECGFGEWK